MNGEPNLTASSQSRSRRPHPGSRRQTTGLTSPRLVGLIVGAVALILVTVALATRADAPADGQLMAEHTVHDFGQVQIDGGLLAARIPLVIQGVVRVTDVGTT